jgi:hypothetical protein
LSAGLRFVEDALLTIAGDLVRGAWIRGAPTEVHVHIGLAHAIADRGLRARDGDGLLRLGRAGKVDRHEALERVEADFIAVNIESNVDQ